jgi:hypothetical protein
MQATERRFKATAHLDPMERELRDMTRVVAHARRNPWFGGDVLEPEFRPVLSAIVAPRLTDQTADIRPADWRGQRNLWREVLEQVG